MPWSDRQREMLREMGLRVWPPAGSSTQLAKGRAAGVTESPLAEPFAGEPSATPVPMHDAPSEMAPQGAAALAQPSPAAPAAARPDATAIEAVAGLDWPALREAVTDCRACRLCESRKQTVFGVGHPRAHWMIVGEAPGAQEDEQGEPFVGAAGQLLDSMLRALGLDRSAKGEPAERVFIANTLKCRPPGNRNPQPDEMQRCEPFLVRQIQLVQPRIILAMGRFAVQALLRTSEPIGRLRGRPHRYQGVPLVVTYHPAYLLRNLPDKARAWEDLCLAADLMDAAASGAVGSGTEQQR
ncbi:MAG: uracil-DNA glycosylase [Rubrivivax sp.]|nr:uracil-DNA glycosylase [Rubrivivax sp.]